LVSLSLCSNKRWRYPRHGHRFDHRQMHMTQYTSASPETAKQNCMPRLLDLYRATRTRRTHQENASGKASHDPKIARGYPNCTQQQSEHPIVIRVSTILILRRLQNSEKKQGCSRISIVLFLATLDYSFTSGKMANNTDSRGPFVPVMQLVQKIQDKSFPFWYRFLTNRY
jgi:hypothetical protein